MGHIERKQRIMNEMRKLGVSAWGMQKTETQFLPKLIHDNEILGGIVYGHGKEGSIMLVATDRRLLYVDTKPFFKKFEDISYDVVAGVTMEWVGLIGTIIVHTRMDDISVRTINEKAANIFREYVEARCIEHERPTYQTEAITD